MFQKECLVHRNHSDSVYTVFMLIRMQFQTRSALQDILTHNYLGVMTVTRNGGDCDKAKELIKREPEVSSIQL